MSILDPDTNWRSTDKVEHLVGGFAIGVGALLAGASLVGSLAVVLFVGGAFELGQVDTARNPNVCYREGTSFGPLLGRPGFGFGVLDLGADLAGGLLAVVVALLYRALA